MPHDYYSMSIDDAALMFKGWYEVREYEYLKDYWLVRMQTIYLADVTNKSAGGKGVDKAVRKAMPHPWDKQKNAPSVLDKLQLRKEQSKAFNNGIKKD